MARILRAADHRMMPWKNGGGFTREVAVEPGDAATDAFDWRISIADVALDGPFSLFPGVDRVIVVVGGAGMVLRAGEAFPVTLDTAAAPYAFPGDVPAGARLIAGPITDLNVMTRRGHWRASMRRGDLATLQAESGASERTFLVVLGLWKGRLDDRIVRLGRLDVLALNLDPDAPFVPGPGPATGLLIRLDRV